MAHTRREHACEEDLGCPLAAFGITCLLVVLCIWVTIWLQRDGMIHEDAPSVPELLTPEDVSYLAREREKMRVSICDNTKYLFKEIVASDSVINTYINSVNDALQRGEFPVKWSVSTDTVTHRGSYGYNANAYNFIKISLEAMYDVEETCARIHAFGYDIVTLTLTINKRAHVSVFDQPVSR